MYRTKTTFSISAAHQLMLNYQSLCSRLHGHNWRMTVYCEANELNESGMVIDFTKVKSLVKERLDHNLMNQEIAGNPTAENIARFVASLIDESIEKSDRESRGFSCYRVEVEETPGNCAVWERD